METTTENTFDIIQKNNRVSIEQIIALENEILKLEQVDLPITHEFIDGVYARSMFIPAGTVLTGAVHKKDCFMIIRYGDLTVYTDEGMKRCVTGDLIPSKAGIKRVGVAHEDTFITGFLANPTNEKDIEKLWDYYVAPNDYLLNCSNTKVLEAQ
jgi:hypothetical protein